MISHTFTICSQWWKGWVELIPIKIDSIWQCPWLHKLIWVAFGRWTSDGDSNLSLSVRGISLCLRILAMLRFLRSLDIPVQDWQLVKVERWKGTPHCPSPLPSSTSSESVWVAEKISASARKTVPFLKTLHQFNEYKNYQKLYFRGESMVHSVWYRVSAFSSPRSFSTMGQSFSCKSHVFSHVWEAETS